MLSDIFALSAAWSRTVIEFAADLPPWLQSTAHAGTDLLLGRRFFVERLATA